MASTKTNAHYWLFIDDDVVVFHLLFPAPIGVPVILQQLWSVTRIMKNEKVDRKLLLICSFIIRSNKLDSKIQR